MTFSTDARANALAAVVATAVAIAVLPDYFLYAMALWIVREIYFRPTVVERTCSEERAKEGLKREEERGKKKGKREEREREERGKRKEGARDWRVRGRRD